LIEEYYRPQTLAEAISLLERTAIETLPLGGGSVIARPVARPIAVVDLQDLGLATCLERGNWLDLGATLTLQALLEFPRLPQALRKAIQHEATRNLRQVATIAGTLVAASGRSPFASVLLALDALLVLQPGDEEVPLSDLYSWREHKLHRRLIKCVTVPLNASLAYEYVARTPADLPIVCAAVAQWPSGRTRIVLGGFGKAPQLALDGPEPGGAEVAARAAYSQAEDEWATAEYRQEIAALLVRRCLGQFNRPDGSRDGS
jgi:CO/xanthine dehydrogenase FAD-binding subunit